MFERFTERARQVVVLAQEEARRLNHGYIGTEHLLLGLIREEEGIAAKVLESHAVTLEAAREQVARIVGRGDEIPAGQMPFTPRSKEILELSLREALGMKHDYIGTEHLLIALLHEGGGVALHVLDHLGAPPEEVWTSVHRQLATKAPAFVPMQPPVGSAFFSTHATAGERRPEWAVPLWPSLVAGAAIFAGGLFAGWLIWG